MSAETGFQAKFNIIMIRIPQKRGALLRAMRLAVTPISALFNCELSNGVVVSS
jgi:hypothetical protein